MSGSAEAPRPWPHAWAQPGTYNVYLQVTAPDTSGGGSNSVQVVVCPQQGNTTVCTKPKPQGTAQPAWPT